MAYAWPAHRLRSADPATALLEVLVHARIDPEDMQVNFRYLEIEAADTW
jgi:hypothetical protein